MESVTLSFDQDYIGIMDYIIGHGSTKEEAQEEFLVRLKERLWEDDEIMDCFGEHEGIDWRLCDATDSLVARFDDWVDDQIHEGVIEIKGLMSVR